MSSPFAPPLSGRELRRQQAREARRKPGKARALTLAQAVAPLVLLENARPFEDGEKAHEYLVLRAALERLVDGSADTGDFDHVAMHINIVKIRALEIDEGLADLIEQAQDAMGRAKERWLKTNRFGFDGAGLVAVREAMDAAEAIVDASSPLQMAAARDVVADRLLGKGTAARLKAHAKALISRAN